MEWSGILFYRPIGEPHHENFKVELVDILPMDMGNATFTSYELGPEVVGHMMDNDLLDCKIGHIHSHNTMNVFFSGTDMDELNDNVPFHNYYVSLIVNNYMDFKAKVAFKGVATMDRVEYVCKDSNGEEYVLLGRPITKEVMFHIDCNIVSPAEEITAEEVFRKRVEEIMKPKPVAALVHHGVTSGNAVSKGQGASVPFRYPGDYELPAHLSSETGQPTAIQQFAAYLLRLGMEVKGDTLEEALDDTEEWMSGKGPGNTGKHSAEDIASGILELYTQLYEQFWDEPFSEEASNLFINRIKATISEYEEWEGLFDFLSPLLSGLRAMKNSFIKEMKKAEAMAEGAVVASRSTPTSKGKNLKKNQGPKTVKRQKGGAKYIKGTNIPR